jgi:hypothetical protein
MEFMHSSHSPLDVNQTAPSKVVLTLALTLTACCTDKDGRFDSIRSVNPTALRGQNSDNAHDARPEYRF